MPRTRVDFRSFRARPPSEADRRLALLDAVARAPDHGAMAQPLGAFIADLGFPGFAFGLIFSEAETVAGVAALAGGPLAAVAEAYMARGLVAEDPIVRRALREDAPFVWTPFFAEVSRRGPAAAGFAVVRMLEAHGVAAGGTIPLAPPGAGFRAALSVCGPAGMDAPAFEALFAEAAPLARLAGLALCQTGAARLAADPSLQLSPSERDVLSGLARGLRPAEIAAAAGKSEHTVRNQIAAAQARLGAATPTEAVARALRFGLLLA